MEDPTVGLTSKQQEKLVQFKKSVSGEVNPHHVNDDHYYLRWLKARNFDVKNAVKMLLESLEWRKEWDADNILKWSPPEVLLKHFSGGFSGFDKEGCPVYIEPFGNLDMKGLQLSAKRTDILRYFVYEMERLMAAMESQTVKLGRRVDKVVVIEDWEGFGMKQLFTPGMKDILTTGFEAMEKNYPEILKHLFIVHAPGVLPIIWTLVKPFLSEDTKEKIQVIGTSHKETLLQYIPEDQLPKFYGGNLTDDDGNEYCLSKVRRGSVVPEKYYLTGTKMVEDESKVVTVKVKGGAKLDIEVAAKQKGDILKWVFWTDDGDISFGVLYKEKSGNLKPVEELCKVNCFRAPEDGAIECKEKGTYVARFDNTHSWVTGKNLHYFLDVSDNEIADGMESLKIHL